MTRIDVHSVEDFAMWLITVRQKTDAVWILMQEWEAYCNSTTTLEVCPSCYKEMFRICESDGTKQCLNCGYSLLDDDEDAEDHEPNWSVLVQFMGRRQRIDVWISPAIEEPTMTDVLVALETKDLEEPFHIVDWEPYV